MNANEFTPEQIADSAARGIKPVRSWGTVPDPFKLRLCAEEDIYLGAFVQATPGYGLRLARDGQKGLHLGMLGIEVKAGQVVEVETSVHHAMSYVLRQDVVDMVFEAASGGAIVLDNPDGVMVD